MRDPLQRIHNIKLALVAVSVSFVGFALMVFARWLDGQPQLADLAFLPWGEVGTTLFTAGILGIGLDYLLSKDDDERAEERLRRVLTSQAPAMRAAVIDGFAFNAEDLAGVATPDTLDRIIRNSLALRLGDAEFAAETYDDVRDKAITATERWHDAKISIRLSTDRNTSAARVPAYVATIRWEYTTVPTHAVRRFTVVSDRAEYRELMNDSEGMSTWFVRPEGGIDAGSTDAFELVQFSVDGDQKTIRRSTRRHGQSYTAPIGLEHVTAGKPVAVAYTYRVLLRKEGHLLHLDMEQPTRNVDIDLDYSDTDIDYVNVLDFFVSSHKTRVEHMPPTVPERSITVAHDGWVSQRSGVAFVWSSGGPLELHT
ncbi:hypothetical protein MPY17_13910 [Rhodococcus opacus]|uniref:hypothetical protein n=1 Tax=Rhodococcus opacus TaxID=37919 RepID=UPI001FF52546|nr:hypothetical protein [Rhodococcus opacus]UOT06764.1 hypothetical protein MPY17_13910 [Rhodococcus opacus]